MNLFVHCVTKKTQKSINCVYPTFKQLNDCDEPFYCPNCIVIRNENENNKNDNNINNAVLMKNNANNGELSLNIDKTINEFEDLVDSTLEMINESKNERIGGNNCNNNDNSSNSIERKVNIDSTSLVATDENNNNDNKENKQNGSKNNENDSDLSDIESDFGESSSCPEINEPNVNWKQKEKDRLYNTIKICVKRGHTKSGALISGATLTKQNWKDITKESGIKRTQAQVKRKFGNIIQTAGKRTDTDEHKKWNKLIRKLRQKRAQNTVASGMLFTFMLHFLWFLICFCLILELMQPNQRQRHW